MTIEIPANYNKKVKVITVPFKELKTLTGIDRKDRCWPYCISAMFLRDKGTTDMDKRRNNYGLLYCPCHTTTGHTTPGEDMHEIPETITTEIVQDF